MFDALFGNAAKRLSMIIKIVTFIEMIGAVIAGFVMAANIRHGGIFALLGFVSAGLIWVGSLLILAFLDMAKDVREIKNKLADDSISDSSQPSDGNSSSISQ